MPESKMLRLILIVIVAGCVKPSLSFSFVLRAWPKLLIFLPYRRWCVAMLEVWKRNEFRYAMLWGVDEIAKSTPLRPAFLTHPGVKKKTSYINGIRTPYVLIIFFFTSNFIIF